MGWGGVGATGLGRGVVGHDSGRKRKRGALFLPTPTSLYDPT